MQADPAAVYDEVHRSAERIVAQLTFEEKVKLLSGRDLFRMSGVSRLKLPYLKTSDGPGGVRGAVCGLEHICGFPFYEHGVKAPGSAMFPCPSSLACAWSVDAARDFGAGVARDGISKGAHVVLAPTINAIRDPRNGRSFETMSEDPFLTGHLASHWTSGAQEETGVLVCLKHIVCNECETDRHDSDVVIDETALREVYLRPFEIAIRDLDLRNKLQPAAMMTAYNAINGTSCSNNKWLLEDVLRGEWGFKGLVMSDWFGTYAKAADTMTAGLDLEMPGPPIFRQPQAVKAALENGKLSESALHQRVLKVVELIFKSQLLSRDLPFYLEEETDKEVEYSSTPDDAAKELHRRLGAQGSVLLKNENSLLPLNVNKLRKIVVVGSPAVVGFSSGGGSASMPVCYETSPLQCLQALLPAHVELEWHEGRRLSSRLSLPTSQQLGGQEVTMKWYEGDSVEPCHINTYPTTEVRGFLGGFQPASDDVVIRSTFSLTAGSTGEASISLECFGTMRVSVTSAKSGATIIEDWSHVGETDVPTFMFNPAKLKGTRTFQASAGEVFNVSTEYRTPAVSTGVLPLRKIAFRVGFKEYFDAEALLLEASTAAKSADVVLVFTGTGQEYEGEGQDRASISLPVDQQGVASAIAAAAPGRTAVINQTGSAVEMDFADDPAVASILQVWFGGIELGNTIADLLLGRREPGGRMASTWPKRIEDHPSFKNFPITPALATGGKTKPVQYEEGMLYGHRWYESKNLEPRWWFGYGLGYTTWQIELLTTEATLKSDLADTTEIMVRVTNTGARAGKHVVQVYDRLDGVRRLVGWADVHGIAPSESKDVAIKLTSDALARWDNETKGWSVQKGTRELVVATSANPKSSFHTVRIDVS